MKILYLYYAMIIQCFHEACNQTGSWTYAARQTVFEEVSGIKAWVTNLKICRNKEKTINFID